MGDSQSNREPVKKGADGPDSGSTARYASILQALPTGIVVFDSELAIVEANPRAASLIKLCDRIDKSLASGTDERIWLGWTAQLKQAIAEQTRAEFNEVAYTAGGDTKLLRIVCNAVDRAGATGGPGGVVIIEDASHMAEIQRKLADAERLAIVGRRASKVAHELNNPLDGILRYINLAMRIVEQENLVKPKEYLEQCRRGLMRMVRIVGELLEFSRSTYTPSAKVRIDQVIEDAVKPMEARASTQRIRIARHYGFGLPLVRSGNLFQVFCNLAKNALDAMPDGGELAISTRCEAGNSIVVEFRDTGCGLPEVDMETIFEPFFTTKDKDKGTGLGLAICRDIVESCHGRITAENALEGGSIFTVYLPAAD